MLQRLLCFFEIHPTMRAKVFFAHEGSSANLFGGRTTTILTTYSCPSCGSRYSTRQSYSTSNPNRGKAGAAGADIIELNRIAPGVFQ